MKSHLQAADRIKLPSCLKANDENNVKELHLFVPNYNQILPIFL